MRTTIQLSKALQKIQSDAEDRIKSFFVGKPYERIVIFPTQHLNINTGMYRVNVTEIQRDGSIIGKHNKQSIVFKECELPADALLTILDELERMKKTNQLKKP